MVFISYIRPNKNTTNKFLFSKPHIIKSEYCERSMGPWHITWKEGITIKKDIKHTPCIKHFTILARSRYAAQTGENLQCNSRCWNIIFYLADDRNDSLWCKCHNLDCIRGKTRFYSIILNACMFTYQVLTLRFWDTEHRADFGN